MKNNFKNIIFNIIKAAIITTIVFIAAMPTAKAEEACKDLTSDAVFTNNNKTSTKRLYDGDYRSYWQTELTSNIYVQVTSEEEIKYAYVCYTSMPSELVIQTSQDGEVWEDIAMETDDTYHHVLYTLDTPAKMIRVGGTEDSKGLFAICEIKIFSEGTLPDYVQQWEPTHEDTDMLIFSAHPDDDAVFFCGIIPYYAGELDKKVTVVYMTIGDIYRHSETLNYNWFLHQTTLPLYANFPDVSERDMYRYTKNKWGEEETLNYMVSVIRERKPEVIVSHDLNGEYGHGNHIYTAMCLQQAVVLANDPSYHPESYEQFGTHEVKKLYLHLYEENQIHLDVFNTVKLEEYNGMTAMEIAYPALENYVSQLHWPVVKVHDDDTKYPCTEYGLAYTTVGYDTEGNDLFENIEPDPTPTPIPTATPSPTPELTPTSAPTAVPTATPEPSNINVGPNTLALYIALGIIILAIIILILVLILYGRKE